MAAVVLMAGVAVACACAYQGAAGASADRPDPASDPHAALRRYLTGLGEAERLEATQRFRAEGMPAHKEVAAVVAQGDAAAAAFLARRQRILSRYRVAQVSTLIAADQERHLLARMVERDGEGHYRVEAGVIRWDGRWRIAFEDWGEGDGSRGEFD